MGLQRIASNADAISILVIVFVPLAAATLVPAVHRFLRWPVEVLIWAGLIVVSILRVTGIADAHVREATVSAAWAGALLVDTQISALEGAIRTWLVDNRYGIATIAVAVAGADLLALALIRSHRAARRAMPQVRLGEWFVMPARTAPPAADPLVDLDRRLSERVRAGMQSVAHSTAARAVFVKPFAHALVHMMGPGPARLRMVKLALGFEGHDEGAKAVDVAHATPALADGAAMGADGRASAPAAFASARALGGRRRHRQGWWQVGSVARRDAAWKTAPEKGSAPQRREVNDVGLPRPADHLAS